MARLLTASELATTLSCSVKTVSRMVKAGCPAYYLHRRALRFSQEEVLAWLADKHQPPTSNTRSGRPRKPLVGDRQQ